MKFRFSIIALAFCYLVIIATHLYSPKWAKSHSNATISWDVSGYYMYLPCAFIYHDIKGESFRSETITKYGASPNNQQAFKHEKSGNYVMKYSMGQAIMYSPWFFVAHLWASLSPKYPPDGFSFPYQFCISLGSLLVAFLGLLFIRKVLLLYFSDSITAWVLITLVIGTNYLNYTAIDGAMSHNYLFTLYAILILATINFYNKPTFVKAAFIGFLVGISALTRPTEIITCLIPILWGVNFLDKQQIQQRVGFFQVNWKKLALAIAICLFIGSWQLIYWKYVSGDWIVYSYQDQGFSWLKPHIIDATTSFKCGWLIYTPLMIFGVLGFITLFFQNKKLFFPCLVYFALFIYIAFAWDIWCYGGSLGQRTMVQAYAILVFPLGSFYVWVSNRNKFLMIILIGLISLFCYLNLWFTHQAHKGGMLKVGQMTNAYFWKTIGTYKEDKNNLKLLDTNESFNGVKRNERLVYTNDFEEEKKAICYFEKGNLMSNMLCLNKKTQYSPYYKIKTNKDFDWLRASADFTIKNKEWNHWKMTQFIVQFSNKGKIVKWKHIKVHRLITDGITKNIYIDVKNCNKEYDSIEILFYNGESEKPIYIDNLKVEIFDE